MMQTSRKNKKGEEGQVVIGAVIFFLMISFAVMAALTNPVAESIKASRDFMHSAQGFVTAEALNEDAIYRLNKGLSLPSSLSLTLNNSVSSASVTDNGDSKDIVSEGIGEGDFVRTIESSFSLGAGTAFNYGLQTGTGGIYMLGSSRIEGNVYTNGDITGGGGTSITGTAISANASAAIANQTNTGSSTPTYNITMGTAAATEDFAQSFTVSSSSPVTEVWLYMRQVGSLPNFTVRIVSNSSSNPSGTTLASATISSSQISSTYGWVATNPVSPSTGARVSLTPGTTYWLVVDVTPYWYTTANAYVLGGNNNGYTTGAGKAGKFSGTWNNPSPSTMDGYFQIYLGGDLGIITGTGSNNGPTIGGNAQAHTVNYSTITGNLYCQSGTGNNKNCDTSQTDPEPISFPISDSMIAGWKSEAEDGTVRGAWSLGSNTSTSTSGAMKINGNLTIGAGATLTLNGVLYVTGNVSMSGGGRILLGSSLGTQTGVIVVDGTTDLGGGAYLTGNGQTGSYIVLVSTNTICANGGSCSDYAIDANGGTGSVILNAQSGGIRFSGGARAKSAVGNYMEMTGGTVLQYESGLSNINFESGPSGAWNVNSWSEVDD